MRRADLTWATWLLHLVVHRELHSGSVNEQSHCHTVEAPVEKGEIPFTTGDFLPMESRISEFNFPCGTTAPQSAGEKGPEAPCSAASEARPDRAV